MTTGKASRIVSVSPDTGQRSGERFLRFAVRRMAAGKRPKSERWPAPPRHGQRIDLEWQRIA